MAGIGLLDLIITDAGIGEREADRLFGHHVPILALAGLGERDHADAGNTGSGHNITPWPSASQRTGDDQLHDFVGPAVRSEEHTSELQSLMRISYAVFCLKK